MPELHKNQIAWEAPELPKANFDSVNYQPLADAANYLSNVGRDISSKLDAMQDDQLKADLKLAEDRANAIIDEAASADADYEKLSEMMLSEVQGAFYKYDEATRIRFNRENKTYFDELQLAVSEKILKKKGQQLATDVELNIPLWASEAVAEGTWAARKRGLDKIQETLKGYASPEQIAKLSYKYNNAIDKANLNNLITKGTDDALDQAKGLINNPKYVASLDPYELSVFNARIKNQEIENAKEKSKGLDPLSQSLVQAYAIYQGHGETVGALSLLKKVKSGKDIEITSISPDGAPMCEYIHAADIPESTRLAIITEMKKYDALNVNFERDKNDYNANVNEALTLYQASVSNKTAAVDEALQNIVDLQDSVMYDYLDSDTQTQMSEIVNEQMKARVEASLGVNQEIGIGLTAAKNIGNPVTNISRLLSSGSYQVGTLFVNTDKNGNISVLYDDSNWFNRAPRLTDKYSPYKNNLTLAMLGAAEIYKKDFASNMNKNSVAEFGLFNKILLPGMRDSGALTNTRFNLTNLSYEEAFSKWSAEIQRNGLYNERTTDNNAKSIDRFYQILVGGDENTRFTQTEREIIDHISNYAKTGQANRDFNEAQIAAFGQPKLKKEPSPIAGSNQQRNLKLMQTMNLTNMSTRTEKALKETGFK